MPQDRARTEGGETARRTLRILEAVVGGSGTPQALGTISDATGLNRSVTYRLVRVLEEEEYLRRADGGYVVGPRLVGVAASTFPPMVSYASIRPALGALAERTAETVTLHQRFGGLVVLVLVVQGGEHDLRYVPRIGEAFPLGRPGCVARTVLAYLDEDERSAVVRETTPDEQAARVLASELDLVRRRGWAYSDRVNHASIGGIAAPVPTAGGVEYVVCVSGPSERMSLSVAEGLAPSLMRGCHEVARRLAA